jgi:hypothetical protein
VIECERYPPVANRDVFLVRSWTVVRVKAWNIGQHIQQALVIRFAHCLPRTSAQKLSIDAQHKQGNRNMPRTRGGISCTDDQLRDELCFLGVNEHVKVSHIEKQALAEREFGQAFFPNKAAHDAYGRAEIQRGLLDV